MPPITARSPSAALRTFAVLALVVDVLSTLVASFAAGLVGYGVLELGSADERPLGGVLMVAAVLWLAHPVLAGLRMRARDYKRVIVYCLPPIALSVLAAVVAMGITFPVVAGR